MAAITVVAGTALGHLMFRCADTGSLVRVVVGGTTFEVVYNGAVTRTQGQIEAIISGLCATSDATAATSRLNTLIADLVSDSTVPGEGVPHGVPYTWGASPQIFAGNTVPDGWVASIPWGQVYVDTSAATTAPNTRVELGPIEIRILSTVDNRWRSWQWPKPIGASYPEDFQGASYAGDTRTEPNGNISVTAGNGRTFHFYPSQRITIDPTYIGGVIVMTRARLIVANPALPDDRATARYVCSAGADWWIDLRAAYNGSNNLGIGTGRFKYVTNEWQSFSLCTLSASALRANPPS